MTAIYLHGDLTQFGDSFQFDVATPAEAVRALCAQIRGFRRRLSEGAFRVIRKAATQECDLTSDMLGMKLDRLHELHIVPVVAGANKGAAKAILGVAMIAAAIAFAPAGAGILGASMGAEAFTVAGFSVSFGAIAGFGAMMVLAGVSQMLSPSPKSSSSLADSNASFVFSGAQNTSEQGIPVPLLYGTFCGGSIVVSQAMDTETILGGVGVLYGAGGTGAAVSLAAITTQTDYWDGMHVGRSPGIITSLTIRNGGANYANPTATVVSSTGSGAQIELTQSGGVITGYTIVDGGIGYTLNDQIVITDTF